jgi:methylglutamate dehydrogenase subunit B
MHLITCPWCGTRDQAEFTYRGDATLTRPDPTAADAPDTFFEFTYLRTNPMGWHTEWWHHTGGCRQWVKVVRNTLTHAIAATGAAHDVLKVPAQ